MTGPADDRPSAPNAGETGGASGVVEAVLLDIDGTLLDSNDAHAQAWSDALREAGFEIGSEVVRPLIGMGADKLLPKLTGIDPKSEQGKPIVERRKEIFAKEYLPTVRPFPNARELLERMRYDGLRLVVATSASADELRGLLQALGAEWLVDDQTTSSDAKRSKPDPDIVRVALDKAGASPDRCVMLGDTSYDVEAATKSGVKVVAVRCGGSGDDELRGAAEIYDDPAQVLERYAETVIGRGARPANRSEGRRGSALGRAGEEESHGNAGR